MNTYACKRAIPNSSIVTAMIIVIGNIDNIVHMPPKDNIVQAKPAIIFSNVCPDIILANNRIDKLNTLAIYDINSINMKKGASWIGAPLGKKKPKNWSLCILNAIILIPIKSVNANPNVTNMWLVIVKL